MSRRDGEEDEEAENEEGRVRRMTDEEEAADAAAMSSAAQISAASCARKASSAFRASRRCIRRAFATVWGTPILASVKKPSKKLWRTLAASSLALGFSSSKSL